MPICESSYHGTNEHHHHDPMVPQSFAFITCSHFFCYLKSNWSSTKETNIKIALKCFWFSFVSQNSVDWSDFTAKRKKIWEATTTTTRNFFWQEFYFQIFGSCCFLFGIVISLDQNRLETERKKEVQNHDKTIFVSGNTTRILRQFCFAQSSGQLRVMLCMVAYFFVLFCFLLWATNSLSDIAVHLFSSFAHTLSTIAQCVEQRWEFLWFFFRGIFFFVEIFVFVLFFVNSLRKEYSSDTCTLYNVQCSTQHKVRWRFVGKINTQQEIRSSSTLPAYYTIRLFSGRSVSFHHRYSCVFSSFLSFIFYLCVFFVSHRLPLYILTTTMTKIWSIISSIDSNIHFVLFHPK